MAAITGLITVNGKQVLEVDADPSAAGGTAAPIGSLAMLSLAGVGYLYLKNAAANTAWVLIDSSTGDWHLIGNILTGAGPTTPNEFFGSNNDYDVLFKRNALEGMRMVGATAATLNLLIGLSASVGGRLQLLASAQGDDIFKQMTTQSVGGANIIKVSRQSKVLTTNAVATTLFDIAVPTDSVVHIQSEVVARQTGGGAGTAGDGAVYIRDIHAKNIAGVASILSNQTSYTSEDNVAWDNTYAASGANVRSTVTGEAAKNVSWYTHVEILIATT